VRTDRLQKEYGIEVKWTVFPLHPDTPEEGLKLSELFAGREADIEAMQTRLAAIARVEGLPLAKRTRTYNSRRAQELGKWAESQGVGTAFRQAVYGAYFVDGRDIALIDELAKIAGSVGLPVEEVRSVLVTRSFADPVDADWQRAHEMRISAVPTHLYREKRLAGFGPYEDFVRLVT
jgi:predicted DsbA family dithiol-disulfide isomerase